MKSKFECKLVAKGEELRNPHFQALVDWCELNNIDLEKYILNQGKSVLKNPDLDDDWDYDIITEQGLQKVLGRKNKKRMKDIKNMEVCENCVFLFNYRLTGVCKNLYKKKKI